MPHAGEPLARALILSPPSAPLHLSLSLSADAGELAGNDFGASLQDATRLSADRLDSTRPADDELDDPFDRRDLRTSPSLSSLRPNALKWTDGRLPMNTTVCRGRVFRRLGPTSASDAPATATAPQCILRAGRAAACRTICRLNARPTLI